MNSDNLDLIKPLIIPLKGNGYRFRCVHVCPAALKLLKRLLLPNLNLHFRFESGIKYLFRLSVSYVYLHKVVFNRHTQVNRRAIPFPLKFNLSLGVISANFQSVVSLKL